jgi:ribosome maturation factor RimP
MDGQVEGASDRLQAAIQGFAEPLLADMGLELVEVQYRREGHGWVLRFFIDREGGVTIDVEDLIDHAYTLEVSSPGLERPLKKDTDFTRYTGRLARIKLREPLAGQRVLVGTLRGLEGETVLLETEGGMVSLEMNNIAKARLTL